MEKEERKKYEKEWRNNNSERVKAYKKEWYANHKQQRQDYLNKNKDKLREQHREYTKLKKFKGYGITEEQYIEMFNKQKGKCAICETHQDNLKSPLHIDHNHKTGKVRALLCYKCNHGIGCFNDDIKLLSKRSNN